MILINLLKQLQTKLPQSHLINKRLVQSERRRMQKNPQF